jgi:hypothetical protein
MPGPPPFSSMNSTPADSSARLMAKLFAAVSAISSSAISAREAAHTGSVRRPPENPHWPR